MNLTIKNFKVERIGERKDKYRPIKVKLENEQDKIKILKNLKKLSDNDVRITEDLSVKERKVVKELCLKAKEMNKSNDNNDFKWRVRGSPRS